MEELQKSKAKDVLRSRQSILTKLIYSAGLRSFSDECEMRDLITSNLKERVLSNSIGMTESDRASLLMDNIRRSLEIDPHGIMDEFLCVLFTTCDRTGKSEAKQLAEKCEEAQVKSTHNGFALTKFNEVVECHERTLLAQSSPVASTNTTEDQTDGGPEIPDSRLTGYMSKIQQCIETDQELQQGIIFVITMYGVQGSDIDRRRVDTTFKQLSFAVFSETSLTASDLGWLMQAASQVKYPYTYKYIAFYFSGHGMIDEFGTQFIGTRNSNNSMTKMDIRKYIMNPLLRVKKVHKLFLLDCCRVVNDEPLSIFSDDKMDTSVSEYGNSLYVEAHSVSNGKETISTQVGSEWTRELCRTLDKQQKPFVLIFSEVIKKTGDTDYRTNTSEHFIIKRVNDNVYADLLEKNLGHSKEIVIRLKNEEMREKDEKELKSILETACDNDEIVKEVIKKIKEDLLSLELIDSVCRELQLR